MSALTRMLNVCCGPKATVLLSLGAVVAGIDDLWEAWFGVADMVGMDAHHGVLFLGLSGIAKPLAETLEKIACVAEKSFKDAN